MDLQDFQVSISTASDGRTETKGYATVLYLFQPYKTDDLKLNFIFFYLNPYDNRINIYVLGM